MAHGYNHARVQEYWQHVWDREGIYELDDADDPTYVLGMFPYTSGNLHMGHVRNYAITDAYARFRRMNGDDVLHPMGWDAFGLPAENAAYERHTDPESWTDSCIAGMREDIEEMGFGYDWTREITTCRPEYYRWNQWFFRKFYEEGLVSYEGAAVNWCPDCETVLADAQVVDADDGGEVCWRCETPVSHRELDQWFFTITDYADDLLAGLDDLDGWPAGVKEIQRNWIGKQDGASVGFEVEGCGTVDVFTTRLDTVCGATFLAVSPGHELARALAEDEPAVASYLDAEHDEGDTSAVKTDRSAVNPVTGEEIPVYVAAYVLDDVGTGAVMGVPGHNERDHAFAQAQNVPIQQVVEPGPDAEVSEVDVETEAFTEDGVLVNSGDYDSLRSAEARDRLRSDLDSASPETTYRLRDWLISRQRYWGTPIPVVHCDECGTVLVPESDLPVELPEFVQTRGNPLDAATEWKETECPECGRPAERETDTMDTFVDSSWYFLRYLSPDLETAPFDADVANDWLPVDVYVGGEEHAVLHLLYIRFFTRALSDIGLIDFDEPVDRLVNQGTVLYDGEKMSKTKGNVVSPHEYGAETTRLFVLSAAHPQRDFEWTARDVSSSYDLLQTLYGLVESFTERAAVRDEREQHDEHLAREVDRTIAAVTSHYEQFRFHRAVSEIRELATLFRRYRDYETPHAETYRRGLRVLARLTAPLVPYLGEELWNMLRGDGLVARAQWPEPATPVENYDRERTIIRTLQSDVREIMTVAGIDDPGEIEVIVAPGWKFRAREVARSTDETDSIVERIMADEQIGQHGDRARSYATSLEERRAELGPTLPRDAEYDLLARAAWLLEDEFDARVTVRQGEAGEGQAGKARPGKPAVQIE